MTTPQTTIELSSTIKTISSIDSAIASVVKSLPPGGTLTFTLIKKSPITTTTSTSTTFDALKARKGTNVFFERNNSQYDVEFDKSDPKTPYNTYPVIAKYPLISKTEEIRFPEWKKPITLRHEERPRSKDDEGERAKRASLDEDENTRDESRKMATFIMVTSTTKPTHSLNSFDSLASPLLHSKCAQTISIPTTTIK